MKDIIEKRYIRLCGERARARVMHNWKRLMQIVWALALVREQLQLG